VTIRTPVEQTQLDESSVDASPVGQFKLWFNEALRDGEIIEPNAMALATIGPKGQPSVRIVLLRGCDENGLVFFTNYESRKGHELKKNARAALLFYWASLERQIRIEGTVVKLVASESDAYFNKRPRGHRLSAWASKQSDVVPNRAFLDARMDEEAQRWAGRDIERPPYWGGFILRPHSFEFWQGRRDRVHDRIAYTKQRHGWSIARLSP